MSDQKLHSSSKRDPIVAIVAIGNQLLPSVRKQTEVPVDLVAQRDLLVFDVHCTTEYQNFLRVRSIEKSCREIV